MSFIVAIDGPAGTGKGTITKLVSEELGLTNIDTGAMYRCVTLQALRENIKVNEEEKIVKLLNNIDIKLKNESGKLLVFLNDVDVSKDIRTPIVDEYVAKFAALKCVRDKLTVLQRKIGENSNIIMEGRDIGTTVFPNANVKIYLDASIEERAKRRYKQDIEKGENITYEEILENIKQRHILETQREISPLKKADDAILVDTTNLSIEEVKNKVIEIIKEKM